MSIQFEGAAALCGFLFGSVSLVSIGPNNVMLLREGLVGRHPVMLASIVWGSSMVLLALAIGAGSALPAVEPPLDMVLTWLGVALLVAIGVAMLAPSKGGGAVLVFGPVERETRTDCLCRALRSVLINPLSYLELFVIPLGLAAHFDTTSEHVSLLGGMALVLALNCFGYALGAGLLAPLARRERNRRLFDRLAGLAMIGLAVTTGYSAVAQMSARAQDVGSLERPHERVLRIRLQRHVGARLEAYPVTQDFSVFAIAQGGPGQ